MPRTPRCKCVDCERTFDANQMRVVGDGLMRIFFAVRLSKRIDCKDCVCQTCRSYFLHWQQKMEGDFTKYESYDRSGIEFVSNPNSSVRVHLISI